MTIREAYVISLVLLGLVSSCGGLTNGLYKQSQTSGGAVTTSNANLAAVYAQTIVAACKPASGTAGKCVNCHTSTGVESVLPFADPNAQVAYSIGVSLINVSDPSSSMLLQYLTNGHCNSAECQVSSSSPVYANFLQAIQSFVAAVNSSASPLPSSQPSSAPVPSPTVSATALGGIVTSPVPFPSNPPILGASPLPLSVPITALNAAFGTSSIHLDVTYTVTGTSPTTGAVQFLYDLSNPTLVNTTTATPITLAGFYFAWNGLVSVNSNPLSNPAIYTGTAPGGGSISLVPAGDLDSVTIWASPGDSLSIVVLQSSAGGAAGGAFHASY